MARQQAQEQLVVLNGPQEGRAFPVNGSLSIGRSPENTVQLVDPQISRRHAVVVRTPRGTILRDLRSGNGTYVGDRRILEYRLVPGDIIRIGPMELRYEGEPVPQDDAAEPAGRTGVYFHEEQAQAVHARDAANVYQTLFQAPAEEDDRAAGPKMRERLAALYRANEMIASERDLDTLFERILAQIFELVPAHNGVILLADPGSGELRLEHVRSGEAEADVRVSTTIVDRARHRGEAVLTLDAAGDARFEAGASIIAENISSAMCVPLVHQGENVGVIYVDTRGTRAAFTEEDLQLLVAVAGPAAIAIRNAQYLDRIQRSYRDTLNVLANAIELRDHYTVGHTWRVTNFALEMARTLGWSEEKLIECEMGGVLHDIGKIAIDDAILRKASGLSDEEFAKMKVHPERGARLLQDVEFLVPLIPYALYHHERYDGKGYPHGLAGEDIPLEGRLIAVADTFDAMTSNRPYRKGLDPEIALEELRKGKGTQFDPDCVEALVTAWEEGRIARLLQDYYKKEEKSVACPFCSTYIPVAPEAREGDAFECGVCHRRIRLRYHDAWHAELLPGSEAPTPAPRARTPAALHPSDEQPPPTEPD